MKFTSHHAREAVLYCNSIRCVKYLVLELGLGSKTDSTFLKYALKTDIDLLRGLLARNFVVFPSIMERAIREQGRPIVEMLRKAV